jgi:hypothetical protein
VTHKHRRVRFWLTFTLLSLLVLYATRPQMLSRWFPQQFYAPPTAPATYEAPPGVEAEPLVPLASFRFEEAGALEEWEQKVFKGKTVYRIEESGEGKYLSASSENSSCGLFMKTKHEATSALYLSWKWRARVFPKKKHPEQLSNRSEDDFAARVYVIFEASNLFRSDVIEYVWDESLPEGTVQDSPYSDRIKLFVVRKGPGGPEKDGWHSEMRNPLKDYMKLFGKAPRHPLGIIALMSDSDNTGTSAAADFDEIVLGTKRNNDNLNGEGSK